MKDTLKKVLHLIGSARLAIFLFFVLAVFSIVGTILPQGANPDYYIKHFGTTLGTWMLKLHMDDVYHSWWYVSTLFLFMVNLVVCSFLRFPISWKLFKRDPSKVDPERLPNKMSLTIKKEFSRLAAYISDVLGFERVETKDGVLFIKDKHRWGYLSVYIVHFSLLLIILGAIIGALKGFRGNMWLPEGTTSNEVFLYRHQGSVFLPFSIKLNKFKIEFYPNGMVKEYISKVTIIDGKKRIQKVIRVNHPLHYKGISFYQASYDELPSFKLLVTLGSEKKEIKLAPMNPAVINNRYLVILENYYTNHPQFLVLQINLVDQITGKRREFFLTSMSPKEINFENQKMKFAFKGIKVTYISILQVKKDPGLVFVFLGFGLMIFGLLLVYFFEPKTIWIFLSPVDKEKTKVILGASAKRERDMLRLKLEEIAEKLEKEA